MVSSLRFNSLDRTTKDQRLDMIYYVIQLCFCSIKVLATTRVKSLVMGSINCIET